jgi:hypothetical protein
MPNPLGPKTDSERCFAAYLDAAKHEWTYEPAIAGQVKRPDFAVTHDGIQVIFEVKERRSSDDAALIPMPSGARNFDPVAQTRHLLKKGLETLRDFDGHTCAVVIYNNGNRDARLDPTCIYGSLVGNPGVWANMSADDTVDAGTIKSGFLEWTADEARRYETPKNISAIIALDTYRIPNPAFEEAFNKEVDQQTENLKRPLTGREKAEIRQSLMIDGGLRMSLCDAPGVTVCTNPFATISFPESLFNGPFDERWSVVYGGVTRVFAGEHRLALDRPADESDEI